ncbi:MAG TPA: metal ABC transporter permease [Solirubrobacteraceae bacterium]|nr:metal ABC transporter permease [Solirubrobacteraceae bacterium]HEV7884129.1 metal ABC transporter permease [Solirubrobacteraceae bacterium]
MELLHSGLLQRALVEVVVLGAASGALGVWLLHLRHAYAAESLAHAMLPGLVLASLAGAPLLLGAGGGVAVAALLIALAARDTRVGPEVAVGVTVTTAFGLGAVLALAPSVPARLGELLFGDLLGASTGDLVAAGALAALVAGALAVGHRSLCAAVFDPVAAPSLGVRPQRVELALLALLAVATVAAVQGLGNLLVFALLIAPAAAALRVGTSVRSQIALAAAFGAGAGVVGLVVSAQLDIAAGAAVALAAVALYAVAAIARPSPAARGTGPRRSPVEALGAPR